MGDNLYDDIMMIELYIATIKEDYSANRTDMMVVALSMLKSRVDTALKKAEKIKKKEEQSND